jgi:hypothetical protein
MDIDLHITGLLMTLREAGFLWISNLTNKNWNNHKTSGDTFQ